MKNESADPSKTNFSRRQFLKSTSVVAAAALAPAAAASAAPAASASLAPEAPVVITGKKQPINAIIIGVGGRGSGAGRDFTDACKVLDVEGKIVAVADMFPEKAATAKDNFGVPDDKCFSGFDAYKKALEVPGVNYAILATPP